MHILTYNLNLFICNFFFVLQLYNVLNTIILQRNHATKGGNVQRLLAEFMEGLFLKLYLQVLKVFNRRRC